MLTKLTISGFLVKSSCHSTWPPHTKFWKYVELQLLHQNYNQKAILTNVTELYPSLDSKKWYLLFKGILWSHDLLVKTINFGGCLHPDTIVTFQKSAFPSWLQMVHKTPLCRTWGLFLLETQWQHVLFHKNGYLLCMSLHLFYDGNLILSATCNYVKIRL